MRSLLKSVGRALGRPLGNGAVRLGNAGLARGSRGSGLWLSIAMIVGAVRLMARLGARKREVLFSTELLPGQSLDIRHLLEDRKGRAVG